ncbi:MAG: hypothetical protein IPN86_03005 [Saprospiraceae bacterium]|nr:hypothetical protein [Saprospiraceae bacterium]
MVIKDGNVGIKNDNPQEKLDVNGIVKVSDSLIIQSNLNVRATNATQYQQNGHDLLPKGAIIIWTKPDRPLGWAICDGKNGTPDLSGRFVVGVGKRDKNKDEQDEHINEATSYTLNSKGGTEKIVLTKVPHHKHTYKNNSEPQIQEKINAGVQDASTAQGPVNRDMLETQDVRNGSGQPHTNLPPYYVLYYIMKL